MSDQTTTTAKPRQSRATRAANATQAKPTAPATDPKPELTVVGGTGRSTTGDNGGGRKRAAAQAAKPAPAPAKAAQPVKIAAKAKAERTGPTQTEQKRIVANHMARAVADMLSKWSEAKTGVPAEFAAQMAAGYLNYAPVSEWDDRLPDRSGAGGRGRKNRASA